MGPCFRKRCPLETSSPYLFPALDHLDPNQPTAAEERDDVSQPDGEVSSAGTQAPLCGGALVQVGDFNGEAGLRGGDDGLDLREGDAGREFGDDSLQFLPQEIGVD